MASSLETSAQTATQSHCDVKGEECQQEDGDDQVIGSETPLTHGIVGECEKAESDDESEGGDDDPEDVDQDKAEDDASSLERHPVEALGNTRTSIASEIAIARGECDTVSINRKLYEEEAAAGNSSAQCSLALWYQHGSFGVSQDERRAFELCTTAADNGFARAQFHLGWCLEHGVGCTSSCEEALKVYSASAEQGFAAAQVRLARMYRNGTVVAKSARLAAYWFDKAAANGNRKAQYFLGRSYESGQGVPLSYDKAAAWFAEAGADDACPGALASLGRLYAHGKGVPKDIVQACKLYERASSAGNAKAQLLLGNIHRRGRGGLRRDFGRAADLYERAAFGGNRSAMRLLGECYMLGTGRARSCTWGFAWLYRAVDEGGQCSTVEVLKTRLREMYTTTAMRAGVARMVGLRVAEALRVGVKRTIVPSGTTPTFFGRKAPEILWIASEVEQHVAQKRLVTDFALEVEAGQRERLSLVRRLSVHLQLVTKGDFDAVLSGQQSLFPCGLVRKRVLAAAGA
jgi:TPR repeat protein